MPIATATPTASILDQAQQQFNNFSQSALNVVPGLLVALFLVFIFWIISRIFRSVVNRYGERTRLDAEVRDLLSRIIAVAILVIGFVTALGTIGVDVSALVAGLGLTGFALGFALQDIIANVISGVLLLVNRPFRRGNYIKVGDKEGYVVDVDLRYTTLQRDNLKILIPNQTLFKDAVTIIGQQKPATPLPDAPPAPPA